ncbi:MAG TPA: response regulator [Elusimicrobiota bacterium]|nr:response regulator [Elusimicrobiota bacterium]
MTSAAAPRILIVDDELISRELCLDFLQDGGYADVDTAQNGQEALERLEKKSFQLVLSDINMPVMDGLAFLKASRPRYPRTEIILMTAFGGLQSALEALRFGAYDYITKPFTQDALLASVRRCLEKQMLSEQLRSAQDELIQKEKLAAVGSMAGWLAHRMRNPLNVILMCSQYLKSKFPEKDEKHDVSMAIEDKVKILDKMTRDFIEFSRSYTPNLRPEDINSFLDKAAANIASRCKIQEVSLDKKYAAGLPPVPIDKDLLEEVVNNLLDNALEAMEGPGAIGLKTERAPDGVVVEISNSGAPVPEDVRERIFEPFFTTKERGTGLGLAIARRVVESHGGKITLVSEPATAFRLQFPLEKTAP